jgi:hypothetical protein
MHNYDVRQVLPEKLEELPEEHPDARKSRRDLLMVNAIMRNHAWMIAQVRKHYQPGWDIVELGAGDGALGQKLLRQGPVKPWDLHGVDLVAAPADWPPQAHWHQGNVLEKGLPDGEILLANLILHHFTAEELAVLGQKISPRAKLILSVDPARYRGFLGLGRFVSFCLGFNHVTRHDMTVSVRGGFRNRELPDWLGLGPEWQVQTWCSRLGGYHMLARRD